MHPHCDTLQEYQKRFVDNSPLGSPMPSRDASPIECATRDLAQRIESLHAYLHTLRERVEPVSAPQEPSALIGGKGAGQNIPEPPKAPLEVQLRNLIGGVESANHQLANILDYLHI